MSHNMGVTEQIGISIDLSKGVFAGTELFNGKLRLALKGTDDVGNKIFAESGTWESQIIMIQDKIQAFSYIAKTAISSGNASYKIYTKSSHDNSVWTDWVEIDPTTFKINSPMGSYAKVKIELFGSSPEDATFMINEFDDADKYNHEFMNYDNGVLELKKDYQYGMSKDNSWTESGTLMRKTILKSKFKKINSISIT